MIEEQEVKDCPFCGSSEWISVSTNRPILGFWITCDKCFERQGVPEKIWNTRPLEDALRAKLAARDALIERLVGVAEIKFRTSMPMNEQAIEYGGKWQKLVAEYRASKESVE